MVPKLVLFIVSSVFPTRSVLPEVFFRVTSGHDPAWVQQRLETLAPKLRSQVAVALNLGYTPELRFQVRGLSEGGEQRRLIIKLPNVL